MIVLLFKVQIQPDKIDEALAVFAPVVAPSREVEGVVSFDIARDLNDPTAIIATEVFEDESARERQESLPQVGAVMSALPNILAAPPEATVYQVSSSAPALA